MKLIFATNNLNKVAEAKSILKFLNIEVLSLLDIGASLEVEEIGTTYEENAYAKAEALYRKYDMPCFADDSGLEVFSLGNKPGVLSSRYAGFPGNMDKNIEKLLKEMEHVEERGARFVCVICLFFDKRHYFFKGEVRGTITRERRGSGGFGYDSVFVPDGYLQTFAEMDVSLKNSISHRFRALFAMKQFFEQQKEDLL